MTPHRKKCPHVVHFKVPRDWFETNLRHQKRYSKGGKKIRGCRGLLGRVICHLTMCPALKRCEASGLLTSSKLTFVALIFAFMAVQSHVVCCFLTHAASHEVVDAVRVLLVQDKASGFPRRTFMGLNGLVTVSQWLEIYTMRTFWIKIVGEC